MSANLRFLTLITRPRQTRSRPVADAPSCVESVIAEVDNSLWKLNRYYDAAERTDEVSWELHDLSADPGERENRYQEPGAPRATMEGLLAGEREKKRLSPATSG